MKQRAFIISSILIVLGLVLAFQTWVFVSRSQTVMGTVQSAAVISTPNKGFPVVIAFKDRNGKQYQMRTHTRFRLGSPMLMTGRQVEVIYDPKRPQETAQINSLVRVWLWPGLCLIAGIAFSLAALG